MAGTWVRTGTVTVTNGSKKVAGNGTSWLSNLLQKVGKGCMCVIDNVISEVDYVNSDTELYLVEAWEGATASGKKYKIQVTVTDTIPELSSRISQSLAYANGQYGNLESWATGPAANVTLTSPAGNQVTLPNLAAMNAGAGASPDFDLRSPAQLLRWQMFGQAHTIFDASKGLSPNNIAISNVNAEEAWSVNYPTLMGWNGQKTYGVRVDSAHRADGVYDLYNAGIQPRSRPITTNDIGKWYKIGSFQPSNGGTLGTLHIRGYIGAWVGGKTHIDITIKNRDGVTVSGYSTGRVNIGIYDIGGGTHEVWVYLSAFLLAELEIFAAGNGVQGYLFGDVVADAPSGSLVYDAAQSLPVMLQYDQNGIVTIPGVSLIASAYKDISGNPAAHEYNGSYQPLLRVENNGDMSASDNVGYWVRAGVQAFVHGVTLIKDTTPFNENLLITLPFVVSGAHEYYPTGTLALYNASLLNGIRYIWIATVRGAATAYLYGIDGNGVSRKLKASDISSAGYGHFRFSLFYGV